MLTERLLKYIQVELNDLMGQYDQAPSHKQQENLLDQLFDFFNDREKHFNENYDFEKERVYQQYQQYRQYRKSNFSSSESHRFRSPAPEQNNRQELKYYDALEVKPGASFDEIKAGYKKVMKKYHPDRFSQDPDKLKYAQLICQKINQAYDYFKKKHGY